MEQTVQIDSVTVTAPAKKDQLMARLNKRNQDRQKHLDVQQEQRNKEHTELEGGDYFAQAFTERVREIDSRLENISDVTSTNTNADNPSLDGLGDLFAAITIEVQELQQFLTSSTMFLTDYKIKASQTILNDLSNRCEETRLRLIPKKKFGFKGKKVAIKPKVHAVDKVDALKIGRGDKESTLFAWTLANLEDTYICLRGDEVDGKDITISHLNKCFVELQGHPGSVQISNATDCIFLCGPIARSLFAEFCDHCAFAVACQQLRLHSSKSCKIYLHVTCRAIVEDCNQIEISKYNYNYSTINTDYNEAGLDKEQNHYTDIADFNWLSPDVPSPNWKIITDDEAAPNWENLRAKFKQNSNNYTDK